MTIVKDGRGGLSWHLAAGRGIGRRVPASVLTLVLLLSGVWPASDAAWGAIVCGKFKNDRPKKVRVEAGPTCKNSKWQKVDDMGDLLSQVGTLGTRVDGEVQRVDGMLGLVQLDVGLQCTGNPELTPVPRDKTGTSSIRVAGCRQFDGNQAACEGAFQSQDRFNARDPVSCWYYAGRCLACDTDTQSFRACTNACDPPVCGTDSDRRFVATCTLTETESECNGGFQHSSIGGPPASESCYWAKRCRFPYYRECMTDGDCAKVCSRSGAGCDTNADCLGGAEDVCEPSTCGICQACEPHPDGRAYGRCEIMDNVCLNDLECPAAGDQCLPAECTNACETTPTCAGRSNRVYDCRLVAEPQACGSAWELSGELPQSCFWDPARDACRVCSLESQFADGDCQNVC